MNQGGGGVGEIDVERAVEYHDAGASDWAGDLVRGTVGDGYEAELAGAGETQGGAVADRGVEGVGVGAGESVGAAVERADPDGSGAVFDHAGDVDCPHAPEVKRRPVTLVVILLEIFSVPESERKL